MALECVRRRRKFKTDSQATRSTFLFQNLAYATEDAEGNGQVIQEVSIGRKEQLRKSMTLKLNKIRKYCDSDELDRLWQLFETNSSIYFGEFGASGGVLSIDENTGYSLVIPPGALARKKLVYIVIHYEDKSKNPDEPNFSAVISSGPATIQFKIPAKLIIPHSAVGVGIRLMVWDFRRSVWKTELSSLKIVDLKENTISLLLKEPVYLKISSPSEASMQMYMRAPGGRPGKRLRFTMFQNSELTRICYIASTFESLEKNIEDQQKSYGFSLASEWQDFTLIIGEGPIHFRPKTSSLIQSQIKTRICSEHRAICSIYDFLDIKASQQLVLIEISQQNVPENSIELKR